MALPLAIVQKSEITEKVCRKCGVMLDHINSYQPYSWASKRTCKSCTRAYQRQYRRQNRGKCRVREERYMRKHPERRKEAARLCNLRLRLAVIAQLGGSCANCGVADPRILQINHINGGGTKEDRKGRRVRQYYRSILQGGGMILTFSVPTAISSMNTNEEFLVSFSPS